MNEVPELRSSSLPRIVLCPASKARPEVVIEENDDVAQMGTAVHAGMFLVVKSQEDSLPDMTKIIDRYDIIDTKRFYRLIWNGKRMWDEIKDSFTVLEAEKPLETKDFEWVKIKGHPDVIGHLNKEYLIVIDWKTGFLEYDFSDQLVSYLQMAMQKYPSFKKGRIILANLHKNKREIVEYSYSMIIKWLERIKKALDSDVFKPGDHCKYCPLAKEGCEAHEKMIRSAGNSFIELSQGIGLITAEMLAEIYPNRSMVKKAIEKFDKTFKAQVQLKGEVTAPDGTKYIWNETESDELIPIEMIDTLCDYWEIPNRSAIKLFIMKLRDSITISKTKFLDVIGKGVEKGKGQQKKVFMERLEDNNAVGKKIKKGLKIEKK